MDNKWVFQYMANSLCVFCFITYLYTFPPSLTSFVSHQKHPNNNIFRHAKANISTPPRSPSTPGIPRFAYSISGTKGDPNGIWRALQALYHPRNVYLLHLDLATPESERQELASRVNNNIMFRKVRNVHVIVKPDMITYRGPTMVAHTLHACSILLKKSKEWDWYINLSASDYPLVTPDDMLHAFSPLPRNLNFIDHTSQLGWKEVQRGKPLMIDPGLYKSKKSDIFLVGKHRDLPTAFKLFTGSAWMVLSREFVRYSIFGWDNLPRTLLMYYTNFVSSSEGYFQTLICNTPKYASTVVSHDLHYIEWDWPPKQHPRTLTVDDTTNMVNSNAPFARKFKHGDPVLDKINVELLGWRRNESFVPGGWCAGSPDCSELGNPAKLNPGPGADRLAMLMHKLVMSRNKEQYCK